MHKTQIKRFSRCYNQLSNNFGVEYSKKKAIRVSQVCNLCWKPYGDNCFNNHFVLLKKPSLVNKIEVELI